MLMDECCPPKIVVYNTAKLVINAFTETRLEDHEETWRAMVFSVAVLAQSLAREYQARGVHVAHFILDGIINSARSRALHSLDSELMM